MAPKSGSQERIPMKVLSVVGARPNFMKIAPFVRALERHNARCDGHARMEHLLVHTGQHYDDQMSRAFFADLRIPEADINLGIGSGSHAEQVGRTMIAFEKVVRAERPDWIVVVGDVNATCACSITAKKEHVRLAHIEAGLRSGDLEMPEEINRLVTDRLSDLLFTPDRLSCSNLRAEGTPEAMIQFVGNIMIDTLEEERARATALALGPLLAENRLEVDGAAPPSLGEDQFAVVTLHRPSNVDDPPTLAALVAFLLDEVAQERDLIWPIHPRTRKQLEAFGLWQRLRGCRRVHLLQPLGYHAMLRLTMSARVMLTDSGGLQEECCVLGTPCLTMRWNTERPITLRSEEGTSWLVGNQVAQIRAAYQEAQATSRLARRPELWDGQTAVRIVDALAATAPRR